MKSFGKTFRTFLAMSLALCMVMSFVTVSADAVTLAPVGVPTWDAESGYYSVQYKVSDISAEGGNATILVYETNEAGEISNTTIEYANQAPVVDGEATFTMLVENGNYTVLAGGTGFATAATAQTFSANREPVIADVADVTIKNNLAISSPVATVTATDADSNEEVITYGIKSGNEAGYFALDAASGVITVANELVIGEYTLTVTATDSVGGVAEKTVKVIVETSVITAPGLKATTVEVEKDWNTTVVEPGVDKYIDLAGATLSAWVLNEETGAYEATLTLPANYAFANGEDTAKVTYTIKEIDSRDEVTFEYDAEIDLDYGDAYADPAITYIVDGVATALEDVVVSYEGDEVLTRVDSATYYRKAYITLPAGYRVAGTSSVEHSLPITITVNDNREPVKAPTFEKIVVQYGGTTYELPELDEDSVFEFATEWDGPAVDTKVVNDYTFKATVKVKEEFELTHKLDGEDAVSVVVEVQDNRKTISDVDYNSAVIEVAYGTADTKIEFPKVTFAGEYANVDVVLSAWTCAEGYNPETPGTYVFTATVLNENTNDYKFAVTEEIKVTVNVAKKDVTITGYEYINVADLEYGNDKYALPLEVIANTDVEDHEPTFTVDWGEVELDTTKLGQTTYSGTVVAASSDVYNYILGENTTIAVDVTVTATVTRYEFLDEEGGVVAGFSVNEDATWDETVETFFPTSIKLYSGDLFETVDFATDAWINHKNEGFPPAKWTTEPFAVDKEQIALPENWKWAVDAENPTINVTTFGSGANIVLRADGYEKKYVASRLGADSIITVDEITGAEAYAFTLNSAIAPEASDAAWGTTREYTIPADSDDIHGTRYAVTAHVKLLSGEIVSETIYVTKYTSVFSGSVYINDTVDELDYSAVRSNRNRDIVVSYKFSNANDTGYVFDGEAVVNVYSVNDLETPILTKTFDAGSNTITITSAEVKEFAVNDGEYKFCVTYTDDNEKIGDLTARKGTYISNNGTWYSDFVINNLTRSGIIVRKDETLTNEFTLAELGADGKAYIGYSLIGYNDTFADISAENYKETSSAYNKHEYDLTEDFAEKANASYKFYSMVKLDSADQKYFDMNVSRVVYVYGSKTTISNLNMNGSNSAGPVVKEGKIVFKPNWYNEASKNLYDYDEIRYELTFTSGTSYDRLKDAVVDGEVVENTTTVKFADTGVGYDGTNSTVGTVTINANAFDSKVVAELKVYVDNKLDRTVNKIFWPIAE